jgi:hypothetical protein
VYLTHPLSIGKWQVKVARAAERPTNKLKLNRVKNVGKETRLFSEGGIFV